MEKARFDFFQDHSESFLKMALSGDHLERIQTPDGYGTTTSDCGDTVVIYLIVRKDRIRAVSCKVDGCINTTACANTVAHLAQDKTIDESWQITPETVIAYLETLPPESAHCAELAVGALHRALSDYAACKQTPWKKPYRRTA